MPLALLLLTSYVKTSACLPDTSPFT
jgi:hypothetical protein